MSAVDRLLSNYSRQVRLPWSANMSGKQRVWFAVYPPTEERRVRARLPHFDALTLPDQHVCQPLHGRARRLQLHGRSHHLSGELHQPMTKPIINRELYFRDPTTIELLNNGVSKVSEIGHDERQIRTLRFELETFVCDGEYARG